MNCRNRGARPAAAGFNEDGAETSAPEACAGWPISREKSRGPGSDMRAATGRGTFPREVGMPHRPSLAQAEARTERPGVTGTAASPEAATM